MLGVTLAWTVPCAHLLVDADLLVDIEANSERARCVVEGGRLVKDAEIERVILDALRIVVLLFLSQLSLSSLQRT